MTVPIVVSAALAGCGGDDHKATITPRSSATTSTPVTTGPHTQLNAIWPLTGRKLVGDFPHRPVYVVKIDNSAASAPQIGLRSADMIVEELVEGGITRLAVFFYSHLPPVVGPVRSMRASDIGIVTPVNSVLVASGGAPRTVVRIRRAHIKALTEGAHGYFRDYGRIAPHNLMMRTSGLQPGKWKRPTHSYLQFSSKRFKAKRPVHSMSVTFSPSQTTLWSYRGHGWTRPNSYAKAGNDFTADNVLVLKVRVGDAGYLDPAGSPVPETIFTGSGKGTLVHGSHRLNLRWHKKSFRSALTLTGPAGNKLTVPPGRTWIELIPSNTGHVVFRP
jgi:Protein of unknown function (DUF3048) N-terminal domain/Protein of unknown function (DUF3048) C-terminal domain